MFWNTSPKHLYGKCAVSICLNSHIVVLHHMSACSAKEVLEVVVEGIARARLTGKLKIALNVAASRLYTRT